MYRVVPCRSALEWAALLRGWRNTVEIVLFEISNSTKLYPSVFHAYVAYTNNMRLVIGFLGQQNSMRFPTVFRQPLTIYIYIYIYIYIHTYFCNRDQWSRACSPVARRLTKAGARLPKPAHQRRGAVHQLRVLCSKWSVCITTRGTERERETEREWWR